MNLVSTPVATQSSGAAESPRARRWHARGEGPVLPPALSCRSEMGAEQGKDLKL